MNDTTWFDQSDEDTTCDVCAGRLWDGDEPGALLPTATEPSVLVCSERCSEVGSTEAWRQLRRVRKVAMDASRALVDEREGDFSRDILELHTHAGALVHLVATW